MRLRQETCRPIEKGKFYLPQGYLALSLGMIPFEYQQDLWHQKTRVPGLTVSPFDTILTCVMDEQTDGRTYDNSYSRASTESCGKNLGRSNQVDNTGGGRRAVAKRKQSWQNSKS